LGNDAGALRILVDARRFDFDDDTGRQEFSSSSGGSLDDGYDDDNQYHESSSDQGDGRELVRHQSTDRNAATTEERMRRRRLLSMILREFPQLLPLVEVFRAFLHGANHFRDRDRRKRSDAVESPTADVLFRQKAVSHPSSLSASSSRLLLHEQRGDENAIRGPENDNGAVDNEYSADPHAGMVLTIVHSHRHEAVSYELLEIMHLELGGRAVHVNDYAYTPVLSDHDAKEGYGDESEVNTGHLIGSSDSSDGVAIASTGASVCRVAGEGDDDTQSLSLTMEEAVHNALEESSHSGNAWWQWWIPKRKFRSYRRCDGEYRMNQGAFAGGSHGQVWRGRRRCDDDGDDEGDDSGGGGDGVDQDVPHQGPTSRDSGGIDCGKPLVLKRLKVDAGYRMLEAGLREVHFGRWLASLEESHSRLFTRYVDHFFREDRRAGEALDLWIVFEDAGPSLRSYLYTGIIVGDLVLYQQSALWTRMRLSVARKSTHNSDSSSSSSLEIVSSVENLSRAGEGRRYPNAESRGTSPTFIGREVMRSVLRQILEAAAFLHSKGIVHRDIKPSNVMCSSNITVESILNEDDGLSRHETHDGFPVHCVLGDFSSAWSMPIDRNLYTRGPSRREQTDEYAPPEAIFGNAYNRSSLSPAFDSWSIGTLALEMVSHSPPLCMHIGFMSHSVISTQLLGSPNVFTVDQRTRAVLTQKLKKNGATEKEIQHALYLAALSQFCIYDPLKESHQSWTHHVISSIHKFSMVKASCTLHDFHRALRARDPLGLGFDESADTLLHLIWQLLAWNPDERMLPAAALQHSYFAQHIPGAESNDKHTKALESQMLDPRMDFNLSTSLLESPFVITCASPTMFPGVLGAAVDHFVCPKCGRSFYDWNSCLQHVVSAIAPRLGASSNICSI
jgi:serine/threonine protein kinase